MAEIKNNKSGYSSKDIEAAIGGNTVKAKPTKFEEKQAEAVASAALKAALDTSSQIAEREADKTYAIEKQKHMLERCKNDAVVKKVVSKLYAPYLGKVYTFAYNGVPVTIYCDGKPHEYPKFIADKIDEKLNKVSESNTYKEIIEEKLEQGTF